MSQIILYSLNTDATTPTWQECCRVRDYLNAAGVEFDDRNIRQSEDARQELLELSGELVVPQLHFEGRVIPGFDPDALDEVIARVRQGNGKGTQRPKGTPPANSLEESQHGLVAPTGDTLEEGVFALLGRIRQELGYNEAKGSGPYRSGMNDGLTFAEHAVETLLERHGYDVPSAQV